MLRFIIYLLPCLYYIALGSALFIVTVRLAESGADPFKVTIAVAVWAFTYTILCQVVGRLITERSSIRMLIFSGFGLSFVSLLFILFDGLDSQFYLLVLQAAACSIFFAPIQVFIKRVDRGLRKITVSIGLYTFSWSAGLAVGPFISAYIWSAYSWSWCYLLNFVIGLLVVAGLVIIAKYIKIGDYSELAEGEDCVDAEQGSSKERCDLEGYSSMPNLAWLGWILAGVGCFAVTLMRGVFPSSSVDLDISKISQGNIIAVLCFSQAFFALWLCRSKDWMYRTVPVCLLGLMGACGMLCFYFATGVFLFYLGSLLLGFYVGGIFFYLVFHSIVHPRLSGKYIAVNESVLGIASVLGNLGGGWLATCYSLQASYFVAFCIILGAVVLQVLVYRSQAT